MFPRIKDILDSLVNGINAQASSSRFDPINLAKSGGSAIAGIFKQGKDTGQDVLRGILDVLQRMERAASRPAGGMWQRMTGWMGFGGGAATRGRGPVGPPQPPVQLSSVVSRGGNFGDLLSGRTTAAQVIQRATLQNATAATNAAGGGGAAGGSAGGGAMGAAGGLLSRGAMGITGFVGAIGLAGFAAKRFAESMVESNRHLARFSGTIGRAYQQLDRGNIMRSRQTALQTAESTDALVTAVNQMHTDLAPMKIAVTNGLNLVGAGMAILIGRVGRLVDQVAVALNLWNKWTSDPAAQLTDWEVWVRQGSNQARIDAQKRRDARRQPPQKKP